MTQHLATISVLDFKRTLPGLSFQTLKSLVEGIYAYKREHYKKMTASSPIVMDMERKETSIMQEFVRRGHNLNHITFTSWLKDLQNKKDKIMVTRS